MPGELTPFMRMEDAVDVSAAVKRVTPVVKDELWRMFGEDNIQLRNLLYDDGQMIDRESDLSLPDPENNGTFVIGYNRKTDILSVVWFRSIGVSEGEGIVLNPEYPRYARRSESASRGFVKKGEEALPYINSFRARILRRETS